MKNIYQAAREAAGMTQERAAELIGLSVESIRSYETEKRIPADVTGSTPDDSWNEWLYPVRAGYHQDHDGWGDWFKWRICMDGYHPEMSETLQSGTYLTVLEKGRRRK